MHKQSLGIFLALIAMYIFSTIHIVCRWILMRNAFIDNGDTSMTTSLYLIRPPLWLTVLGAVVFTANTLVADSVLVLDHLGSQLVGNCLATLLHFGGRWSWFQNSSILRPPYFALSLITTCLATLLIIFRILTMTDHTTRQSRGYSRVIEVVVESALLYSVAMAIFLPLLVRNSSNDAYAQAVVGQVTGIAPSTRSGYGTTLPANSYLTRVATGSATGSDTYEK
ncbi:hypothetical protein B0H14DRAFT_3451277 [Mycena olivaceomarginata]|nr:hypothetical protein B0H14DRAFT_3451277 [Mycena olivaceomarginata]